MLRLFGQLTCLAVVLAASAVPAHAQYTYPYGYGGWGGWGGGGATVGGNAARGMGVFAAGAGAYNVQTAQARSMNADTTMRANEYLYESQQVSNQREYTRMAQRQNAINATAESTYARLHDNPNAHDIHSGDALNVVLDEITNPAVYSSQVAQKATRSIDSQLVKNIPFQYAAKMITISLEGVSARGMPDSLATNPVFDADRQKLKALVVKAREEAHSQNQISLETLRSCRVAIKSMQDKVASTFTQGSRDRIEADNYLKALYGLSKMLETPDVDKFLMGLNNYPTTTLGLLIGFMHNFNLRFGAAKNPSQEAAYDQLYPLLVDLRDRAQVQGQNPFASQGAPPDPRKMTQFFSGMDYSHFQPQPDPHAGAVAPPPQPR